MHPASHFKLKLSPLLAMHESSQKCKTFNLELLKQTKFNKGCYTCPNEQVRYSIASYRAQLQDYQVSQPLDEVKFHEQRPKHDQSISKWQSHTNFMLGQPF
jgi:hypothetical protein